MSCGTGSLDKLVENKATDAAACVSLEEPIDTAINTTIKNEKTTPPEVIVDWNRVVETYDSLCQE